MAIGWTGGAPVISLGSQTIEGFLLSIKAGNNGIQMRRKDLQDPVFETGQDSVHGGCRRRLILSYLSVGDRPQGLGGPFGGHLVAGVLLEAKRGRFGTMIFPTRKTR